MEPVNPKYSKNLQDLINSMLKDEQERPSLSDLFNVPFIKEYWLRFFERPDIKNNEIYSQQKMDLLTPRKETMLSKYKFKLLKACAICSLPILIISFIKLK